MTTKLVLQSLVDTVTVTPFRTALLVSSGNFEKRSRKVMDGFFIAQKFKTSKRKKIVDRLWDFRPVVHAAVFLQV